MKKNIRNFCIIAHIDHGKSTLADRLLEFTNTIQVTEGQMLDDMDLEKERGITIKSHAIQMEYVYKGEKYILNLIDTPGHVDFSYEVSRSIAACEGALLIVDASQGVQAQTISNLYMAIEHDLEIIPVINKCDMASAMPEEVEDEIVELLGCKREEIIRASGKTGMGVEEILEAVVERIPHPEGDEEAPLQALIFDSVFNSFRGIIAYFKIVNGVIRKGRQSEILQYGQGIRCGRNRRAEDGYGSPSGAAYGRRGVYHFGYQDFQGSEGGRHDYAHSPSVQGGDCRLRGSEADGLCRRISH